MATQQPPSGRLPTILAAAGFTLLAGAAIVWLTGGMQVTLGPVRFSATAPSRLVFEGTVALLLAVVATGATSRWRTIAALTIFLVSAAFDSNIRRVGDGVEYLTMARTLVTSARPSATPGEYAAVQRDASARGDTTWTSGVAPLDPALGRDGRYDFPHFWLYSFVAAPLVALSAALGFHAAAGFAALNLLLVLVACWMLVRAGGGMVAVAFGCLVLWWIDKAHAEAFITSLSVIALLMLESTPQIALPLLGLVTAQMPVLGGLFAFSAVVTLSRKRRRPVIVGAALGVAIAAIHPLYYLIRLGTLSPLQSDVVMHVPSPRALATPVFDPNLGVAWFAPALVILVVIGGWMAVRSGDWKRMIPSCGGAAMLLFAVAQTPNVNHGGTVGMSRYGVWILAVLIPLAMPAAAFVGTRWPAAMRSAIAASVLFAALFLHPRFIDSGAAPYPTPLATTLWTHWPGLDNPLPEVFAERLGHVDGMPPVPAGTGQCEKALVIGTGRSVKWPRQCPGTLPPPTSCTSAGALCYVNGTTFTRTPDQPGFMPRIEAGFR